MKRRRRQSRRKPDVDEDEAIDIIPLIDVMFLLLCFFIFLTLAMVIQKGISVDLAQAKTGESASKQTKPLVISVKADGSIYLNKTAVSAKTLPRKLNARARKNPNRPVHLNADESARHSDVITALDSIRKSELSNLVFTIKPKD